MRALLTLLIAIVFTSCDPSADEINKQIDKYIDRHPVFDDTIIYYNRIADTLVLTFQKEPRFKSWALAVQDYDLKMFEVVNNKIIIPISVIPHFADTSIPMVFAVPNDTSVYIARGRVPDTHIFAFTISAPGKLRNSNSFENVVRINLNAFLEIKDEATLNAFKDSVNSIYPGDFWKRYYFRK